MCGAYILGYIFIRFDTKLGTSLVFRLLKPTALFLKLTCFIYNVCCIAKDFMVPPSYDKKMNILKHLIQHLDLYSIL